MYTAKANRSTEKSSFQRHMIKYGMEWSGNTWNGVTKPGVKNKLSLNGPHLYETDTSQSFLPFSVILL